MSLGKDDMKTITNVVQSGGKLDTSKMAATKAQEMVAELKRQQEAARKR